MSLASAILALALVTLGIWLLATVDSVAGAARARAPLGRAALLPLASAARLMQAEFRPTERPDTALWLAAPVLLVGLVLAALTVMPLAPGLIGEVGQDWRGLSDMATHERLAIWPLLALVLPIGLWPGWILRVIGSFGSQLAAMAGQ